MKQRVADLFRSGNAGKIANEDNDYDTAEFSRLEATIVTDDIPHRPISRDGQHVQRHADETDLLVNELDYDYNVNMGDYPFAQLDSVQDLFSGVLYQGLLNNPGNFEKETSIECFSIQERGPEWLRLDESGLRDLVKSRWDVSENNEFLGSDFFCQHPRWNLQVQGAPLSVYCRHDVQRDLTVYLISHKPNDTVIKSLRELLNSTIRHTVKDHITKVLVESPFDLHVTISNLNFECSKWHVARYRRLQWNVVNQADDILAGVVTSDRSRLKELNKQLQVVSQNVDSHLANVEVFLFTSRAIRTMAQMERDTRPKGRGGKTRQRTLDIIEYVISSMEKQRKWFQNYKGRKDSTMQLVFSLVTQQDALNNIELSSDMKKDSTSMNAIAGLTMVFLPGTFTASVLSAGIFQSEPGARSFKVTGLWWLWIATTLPTTLFTIMCWYWYKKSKERKVPLVVERTRVESKSL
ncbi:hypothetical protein EJ04DRAFT_492412 [Polyplosphaeria fusca]|uniref:Uncharacterized protein n=1 Tax=Polyplosphaeria fusca TaxID=682080 RepID=A0A9P4R113_9PLEO|nr:hypothetical protein EJ04DRAFT_492412 [Polyplosphaeria fusca]